jgi:DNA modification methylase
MGKQISVFETVVDTKNTVYFGDALDCLKLLEDECVDTCVTSPPYYGLRDYGKDLQIGLENTPEEYIHRLVEVFREVRRVLKPDGTLWVNIADSYAGSGKGRLKSGEANENSFGKINKESKGTWAGTLKKTSANSCKPKDLIGIPWMLAFALRADGWFLRQDIIWAKPNPMPESVKDRCTKSHEYIFLLSKNPHYYFDGQAIAEPVAGSTVLRCSQNIEQQKGSDRVPGKRNGSMKAVLPRYGGKKYTEHPDAFYRTKSGNAYDFRPKRNKRDVWTVSTKPFKGSHFATFPDTLITPCILAGSRVGGVVLDPFCGSGTTLMVAKDCYRNGIGIELNESYEQLISGRIGEYTRIVAKKESDT